MNTETTKPSRTLLATAALMALLAMQRAHAADEQVAQAQAPQPVAKPADKAKADETVTAVEQVVVTGTARREGLRKLDASFSITTADEEQIKQAAPASTADLLKIVPGVFAETTGGNAGANIRVRGFPMDGDAPYATMQYNGSPIYAEPKLSFFENSSLFRIDDTIERVEVLRGGPSPIFGSGQPGITVNFIPKKGGDDPEGSLRLTTGTGDLRRVDATFSSKLADKWYFAVGGFFRSAQGVRDTEFPTDRGGQFSANLTRKLDDGEVSIYGRVMNEKNAFFTPIPLVSSDNGSSISGYPGFDPLTATFYGNELRHIKLEVGPGGATVERDLSQGRGASAKTLGLNFDKKLDGWTVASKTSYTTADAPTYGLFTGPLPQTLGEYIDQQAGGPGIGGTARYVNGGGAITDLNTPVITAGMWVVDKHLTSFINETRVSHDLGANNTLTAGLYLADYSSKDLWYLNNTLLMTVQPHARLVDVSLNDGRIVSRNGQVKPAWLYYVNADYNGRATAFYLADEWKVNDQLRVDGGLRYERRRIDGTLENTDSGVDLDGNPITLYDNNGLAFNGTQRTISYSGGKPSWTLGVNYNFTREFSAFARANQGHKFPDFDDLRDGKKGTEDIQQMEVGLKSVTPLYTAFVTAYANRLKNSQFQVFTDVGNVARNGGSKTYGVEFEASVRPVKNLELALTGNLQHAKYEDFGADTGHDVSRQPKLQFRFTPSYKIPTDMGLFRVYGTWTHVGERFGDHANLQRLPKYDTLDMGVLAHFNNGIEVRLAGTNLTNELGITEGNPRLSGSGVGSSGVFLGRPLFGRAYELSVGFLF